MIRSFVSLSAVFVVVAGVFVVGCNEKEQIRKDPEDMDMVTKKVMLKTSMGNIVVELDEKAALITVKNFITYAEEGFYDGTIFHRVIANFMIQGGGMTENMQPKQTHAPIVNEARNGLKNDRGTIAMARTSNPDSATAQFFVNVVDNDGLNYSPANPGYAVFGKVAEGMDVVDAIAAVETGRKQGMSDVPVQTVLIESAKLVTEE